MSRIDTKLFNDLNDLPIITADDIITNRQNTIASRISDIDLELFNLNERVSSLKLERAHLLMEHDMWNKFDNRNMIRVTSTVTTIEVNSSKDMNIDRMGFEDSLTSIMKNAGRPLRFMEIRSKLETFGFKWSKYQRAYKYIVTNGSILENAGKSGYYQLIRK